ncbi:MAG: hypothetical protein QF486_03275 [Candidatus Woesearchaeota archaeon]|jgi:hypothetical protein|nr:hypothetical protein [Candidatus Woesearchaeota archaeon]MDP7181576.1 hypothetical protein [Candidatus Woesearchaeota archaeon]MDP7198618.1 hypothetical protein [Candidatus Woesearchaeota archaeon]MDP7466640.1 hypothetical protein [Candidatus Woesearchaeota archaeon]MDP7646896.1 hypothetical protein [Candidatus Woesearchaeota archaeon]|tara:strand:+ start:470 stop:856 length:387 start_codon:yes stop_codon:yes gene_type:complete
MSRVAVLGTDPRKVASLVAALKAATNAPDEVVSGDYKSGPQDFFEKHADSSKPAEPQVGQSIAKIDVAVMYLNGRNAEAAATVVEEARTLEIKIAYVATQGKTDANGEKATYLKGTPTNMAKQVVGLL